MGVIEQITQNLNKLIEVVRLVDLSKKAPISRRELMLVRSGHGRPRRGQRTTDIRGQIADVTSSVYTNTTGGTSDKLDELHPGHRQFVDPRSGPSGVTGIARGDKTLEHLN